MRKYPEPKSFKTDWVNGWVKPSNSTECAISPGLTTVMFVCDNLQKVANSKQLASPNNWKSKVMTNQGIVGAWPAGFRTDQRFILQRVETNGQARGDLLTYDPTLAANRWGYIFTFGKFMKFDWLYANKNEGFLTYRIDSV